MDEMKKILAYRGVPIKELSREELERVLTETALEVERWRAKYTELEKHKPEMWLGQSLLERKKKSWIPFI